MCCVAAPERILCATMRSSLDINQSGTWASLGASMSDGTFSCNEPIRTLLMADSGLRE